MNLENEHLSQSIIAKFTHRIHISFPNNRIICQKKGNDSNDNHITSSLYQEEGLLTCGEEFDEEYSEEYEEIFEKYGSKKCEKDNKRELNNRFIKKKAQYINFENSHLLELFHKYHNSHIILKMMVLHTDWSDFHLYYPQDCDLLLQL